MARLIDLSLIPALDADGETLSGAELRFYEAETLTGVTVYTAPNGLTAHPTPILSLSNGRFPAVYTDATAPLRARITHPNAADIDVAEVFAPLTAEDIPYNDTTVAAALDAGFPIAIAPTDGITNATPDLQAFIDAGGGYIGPGTYLLGSSLIMKPATDVTCHPDARFIPNVNNMDLVRVDDAQNAFRWSWRGGLFENNGRTGCTAFNMRQAHLHGEVSQVHIVGAFDWGIRLRELCWSIHVKNNYISGAAIGIECENGTNSALIYGNVIENFTTRGILLRAGTISLPVVGVELRSNVAQFGPVGIEDRSRGALISNNYVEGCTSADILLDGAIGSVVEYSYHSANVGVVCLRARNAIGCVVHHIRQQGTRSTGLFDFDGTNTHCTGELNIQSSLGAALGIVTGLKLKSNLNGTVEVGDIGVDTSNVPRVGTLMGGTVVSRSIANDLDIVTHIDTTGATINAAQSASVVFGVIAAASTITFTNLAANQTVRLLLELAAGYSTITVAGKTIDMTGAANGKRAWIDATRIVTASPAVDLVHVTQTTWQ